MTEKKLDELMKNSLSGQNEPSDKLRENVKRNMLCENGENHTMKRNILRGVRTAAACMAAFVLCIGVAANVSPIACSALERIPVIGAITKVVTFRTYENNQGDYTAYLEIPEIENLDGLNDEINRRIRDYSDGLIKMYEADLASSDAEGHYAMTSGYTVLGDNDDYFSMKVWTNIVMAGAQEFNKFYTVDKKNEKILEFSDLYPTEESKNEIRENIVSQMNYLMSKSEYMAFFTDEVKIDDSTKFYINNDNDIVVSFDKYEVAIGAMGVQEFKVGKLEDGKAVKSEASAYLKVEGVVEDATMNTILIKTAEGKEYMFATAEARKENRGLGLLIGDIAIVSYEGELDESNTAQNVNVVLVESFRQ